MHRDHATFISALEARKKVKLTFFSKEDDHEVVRTCAPMDYGPSRRARDGFDRYHFWDYDDPDQQPHTLSLRPEQITSIQATDEHFDPSEFVTWPPAWFHPRDWGTYS